MAVGAGQLETAAPGARVMQIKVVTANGGRLRPQRALVRCAGVLLAAIPLFAGLVLILFDDKRRGFRIGWPARS